MGKPRMIILVRHAQSEGNQDRKIHQTTPDHRVKLTPEGWSQATAAGKKLRSLLHPSDTLHFFTSPYRRTRETTEGILNSLTSSTPDPTPFPRDTIKVYEEPRLREQDFGNFQPDADAMSRMWQERADYGHFFFRIPNGESAADAYDRVSGFNESLWRSFGEDDFASVSVLVTHGLMARVFLMKWYHFSVEYFEDLRNINHCEFVVMKLNPENGKYVLQNQLRTWSGLRKERESQSSSASRKKEIGKPPASPEIPVRKKWDGCQDGVEEVSQVSTAPRAEFGRQRRQNTADLFMDEQMEARVNEALKITSSSPAKAAPMSQDRPVLNRNVTSIRTNTDRDSASGSSRDQMNGTHGTSLPSIANDNSDSESDAKEHMSFLPVRSSMSLALNGELGGGDDTSRVARVRADALGDQSDVEDEDDDMEDEEDDDITRGQDLERSVDGSVR